MLELNKNLDVEVEDFQDSKIYYIYDFYKDPDSIKKGLDSVQPDYFKRHQVGSHNGIHFHDMSIVSETWYSFCYPCSQQSMWSRTI